MKYSKLPEPDVEQPPLPYGAPLPQVGFVGGPSYQGMPPQASAPPSQQYPVIHNVSEQWGGDRNPAAVYPPQPYSQRYDPAPPPPPGAPQQSYPLLTPSYSDYYMYSELVVRHGFLRKVLGLVCVQLAITTVVAGTFILSKAVRSAFYSNPWMLWASFGVTLASLLVLGCSDSARQSHPTNLLLLLAFTLGESVAVGCVSIMYRTDTVVIAFLITTGITLVLTLYAVQTKYDFTTSGGMLLSLLFALMFTSIIGIFWHSKTLDLVIAGVGGLLFSVYIVYDVQLVAGGDRQNQLSADDYILAAINIYTDIINLFIYILRLVDALQSND